MPNVCEGEKTYTSTQKKKKKKKKLFKWNVLPFESHTSLTVLTKEAEVYVKEPCYHFPG